MGIVGAEVASTVGEVVAGLAGAGVEGMVGMEVAVTAEEAIRVAVVGEGDEEMVLGMV